jgi:hypothetical protein
MLLAAVILGGGASTLQGSSALDSRYGSPTTLLLPEINGMGGTGTALYRGGLSNVLNPAFLVAEEGTRLDAAVSLEEAHEDRFVPLFDTFESYVTDTAIASNRHHYFGTGFGLAHCIPSGRTTLVGALSLADRYAYAYDFMEEFRDPHPSSEVRDRILEDRKYEVSGTLRALSGGLGVALTPAWSIGAAVHYAFGSRDELRQQRFYQQPDSSSSSLANVDLDGVNFTVGTRLRLDARLEIGLAYESPLVVTGNLVTQTFLGVDPAMAASDASHISIHYPRHWRAGFSYYPRSQPRTVFSADAVYSEWTDLEDSRVPGEDNPQLLEDTMDVRVGVEHLFYSGFAARFGFRHVDSYADRHAGTSFFTGGIGVPLADGTLSVSAELSKLSSIQRHLFTYPDIVVDSTEYVTDEEATVENTNFRFGIGYQRAF